MQLPEDRKYLATHEWVKQEGELIVVGITDFAQEQLGDLVYVGEFTPGARLATGDTAGVVESVKAASDIYAPMSGELLEFNQQLQDAPDLLNESPYDTWIFKLKPDSATDFDALLDASAYQAQLD